MAFHHSDHYYANDYSCYSHQASFINKHFPPPTRETLVSCLLYTSAKCRPMLSALLSKLRWVISHILQSPLLCLHLFSSHPWFSLILAPMVHLDSLLIPWSFSHFQDSDERFVPLQTLTEVRKSSSCLVSSCKFFYHDPSTSSSTSWLVSLPFQNLMNNCIHSPHDPYLTLTPQHWPPYVELLLRCGIALRHPDNANKIRMTPFHLWISFQMQHFTVVFNSFCHYQTYS